MDSYSTSTITDATATDVRSRALEISTNELWLLSFYRESELAGALLMGRLAQQTDDDDLRVRLTEHCAEEARHAWAWTEAILEVGGTPQRVSETYQSRYHALLGDPSSMLEVLALTQVFERRVMRHFRTHLAWPNTHPVVRRTLQTLMDDEVDHIRWVKDRLDAHAAIHGEAVVRDMLDRFQRADDQIYAELSEYRDCFEKVFGRPHTEMSIEASLQDIAAEALGRDGIRIHPEITLSQLGADSLDLVVFMMAVEDAFAVEFTREDQKAMHTLADVAAKVRELQRAG
ncbi:MAG: phosphopantetheine-binding protein [Gemmatimonadaceae bacterium]